MSISYLLITVVLSLSILGSFLKTVINMVGLPNLVPLIRDTLLIVIFFSGLGKLNIFKEKIWGYILFLVCFFSFLYIVSSIVDNRLFVGIYYLRIYLLPILFFVGIYGLLKNDGYSGISRFLKFVVYLNLFIFFVGLILYVLLNINPEMKSQLFSEKLIPSAWYISGGTWMRMGLPATGPNSLGLIFTMNATLFTSLFINYHKFNVEHSFKISKATLVTNIFIAIVGLVLSFSRSSMLLLIFYIPCLFVYSGVSFTRLSKLLLAGFFGIFVITVTSIIVDSLSGGFITRWIVLNTHLNDPSMLGHFTSITSAIDKLNEYYLYGYPKGTVGPKALIFTGTVNNVENTLLAVIFDMGIFIGFVFVLIVFLLHLGSLINGMQAILFVSFLFPCMLLPYVFEIDMLIYYAFTYLILGFIHKKSKS